MTDAPQPSQDNNGALAVDASLFRLLLKVELRKAQRLRYCVSVVCVCTKSIARALTAADLFFDHFRRQLRGTDAVAPWPPASLALLLIDADSDDIPGVMRRVTAQLTEDSWRAGAVSYPRRNWAADEMLRQAMSLMERALAEAGNPLFLA